MRVPTTFPGRIPHRPPSSSRWPGRIGAAIGRLWRRGSCGPRCDRPRAGWWTAARRALPEETRGPRPTGRGRPGLVPAATALASLLAFVLALAGAFRGGGDPAMDGGPVAVAVAAEEEGGAPAAARTAPSGEGHGAAGEGPAEPGGGAPTSRAGGAGVFDEARVVRELRAFREQLARRARLVAADREAALALLEKVETRIEALDARIRRLEALRDELRRLVGTLDEREERRLARLVKIYEGMKPKKAAAIFDRLEMETLLPIAARMRPARLALVLQAMDPERARELTRRLSESPARPDLSVLGPARKAEGGNPGGPG